MAHIPDRPEISPAAQEIMAQRFRFVDAGHPAMAALMDLACGCIEEEAQLRQPGSSQAAAVPALGPAVDPVQLLQRDVKLPSLPEAVLELQERIQKDSGSASDMAQIISRDVGLSASLLRMVNSAFFSFPSRIETISRAVTVVGTKQLSLLALGASVMGLFKESPVEGLDMERFWRHSLACAVMARGLAKRAGLEEPERFFVAGLLHDLGRPAMFAALPDRGRAAVAAAGEQPLCAAEQAAFGFDHARYGSMLLRKWNFPFFIVMAVLHHHDTDKAVQHIQAGVVHLADVMAQALGSGATAGYSVPPLHAPVLDELKLTPQDLVELAGELNEQLAEVGAMLACTAD